MKTERKKGKEDGVYRNKYHQFLLSGGRIAILLKVYQARS